MASLNSLMLAGATALALLPSAPNAGASEAPGRIVVAAAQPDAVAAAEKAVIHARANLRNAMATGQGLKEARAALAKAEKALEQAKLAAAGGAPDAAAAGEPAPATEQAAEPPAGKPPTDGATPPAADAGAAPPVAAETPPAGEVAAPSEEAAGAAAKEPPAAAEAAPADEPPPAAAAEAPPAAAGETPAAEAAPATDEPTPAKPAKKNKPPKAAADGAGEPPAPAAETPPAAAAETPPPAAGETPAAEAAAPADETAPVKPAKKNKPPKAAADGGGKPAAAAAAEPAADGSAGGSPAAATGGGAAGAAAAAVVELAPGEAPPAAAVEAAPPPPPAIAKPRKGKAVAGAKPGAAPVDEAAAPVKPVVIGEKAADGRIVIRENGQLLIRHDENRRFEASGGRVFEQAGQNGHRIITINRPDGSQIITERDGDGNILRRTRKPPNGQIVVIIDAKPADKRQVAAGVDYLRRLPPIVVNIPMQQYVVESQAATPEVMEETLIAPAVEQVERPYSLEEIRQSGRLRDKVRRIDVDTVNFEFGQATLTEDQVAELDGIGKALAAVIGRNPNEVFLVEGHTDAVGSDLANLALSDRRAESVAEILTYYYKVPPENLVTQGYGEQYLKIPTEGPERENRRVTVRRITPLLKGVASN